MSSTPAIQGATGRRPSTPTGPAVSPGASREGMTGEGKGAAQPMRWLRRDG